MSLTDGFLAQHMAHAIRHMGTAMAMIASGKLDLAYPHIKDCRSDLFYVQKALLQYINREKP